ncbi:MAG: sensor histidine kinase [Candidatus Dadabacteria bacterium]|nr:MAG: sensor histidine kinase [Candidatus Dadabacteria bacterium]
MSATRAQRPEATRPEPTDPLYAAPDEALDRVERVIALCRVVLSISALAIVLLDPREPVYSSGALYFVLASYIGYSLYLLWLFSYRGVRSRAMAKPILVADIAWFTVIVDLSEGGASPFFLFYLFAVCTAAIRWGIRTTLRVALFSAALYLTSVVLIRRLVLGPDFFMRSAHVMRPVYLVILGYLVGYIGEHELSAKRQLVEIASVRRQIGRSRSLLLTAARLARRAARFFNADYLLLQMRDLDGRALEWEGTRGKSGRMIIRSVPPSPWSAELASPIGYRVSHRLGNWGRHAEALDPGDFRPRALSDAEEPGFLSRARVRSLLSVPLASPGGLRARILLGRARSNYSREDLEFCQTLAAQIAILLDNLILQAKAEELAVAEERARIARDLHDGFVQSLASVDVGIEVCRRMAAKDPTRLAEELRDLQRTVKQGYREARRYLERLRARSPAGPDLDTAVRELVADYRGRGELAVELQADVPPLPARTGIGFELVQIIREGLTNILRHAGASRAQIFLCSRNGAIELTIRDDGRGFPDAPAGEFGVVPEHETPWSIRERVAALGGRLIVRSQAGAGSEIRVTLPRAAEQ